MTAVPRLRHGVLVTYQRPEALAITFERLAEQSDLLDHLVVVDNAPSDRSRAAVRDAALCARGPVEHLEMRENTGFTGGVAAGMRHVLERADDRDLIVVLDDDDPIPYDSTLADLREFFEEMSTRDPTTAGVAITGGRFDWRRGQIRRVPDRELDGPVAVDHLAGNQVAHYLVEAVRDAGTFHAPLFFGLSELEFGLRVTRAGYHLYAHGEIWRRRREELGRLGIDGGPSWRLAPINWRRYYVLRNSIYMLRRFERNATASRVALANVAKPLLNLPLQPALAARHLIMNVRACVDGWAGRMGRRVEPGPDARHARKAGAIVAATAPSAGGDEAS